MKVNELMTTSPETCRPGDNLAEAVALLWKADCGALPVTDGTNRLAGIVTDRDICIALGTRNVRASDVRVESVMRTSVRTCGADEDVLAALGRMGDARVRRLPVVDDAGHLAGILSIDDVVLAAGGSGTRGGVRPGALLDSFKAICAHPLPAPVSLVSQRE